MQLTISRNQQAEQRDSRWEVMPVSTSRIASKMMLGFQYPSFESATVLCLDTEISGNLDIRNGKHEEGARFA